MGDLKNIESIISALRDVTQCVKSYRKIDGITIECESKSEKLKPSAKNEVQAMSKKFGVVPNSVQDSKVDTVKFAIQYPELMPIYDEDSMRKMYRDNFKFLVDNIKMKDPSGLNKNILYENMESITRHSITIYCKSNINMYKESVDDYLNDKKYRSKINSIFIEFVDDYFSGNIDK